MLEGVIPFKARVRLPWERLSGWDPPPRAQWEHGRRLQDGRNKFLTQKNEGTDRSRIVQNILGMGSCFFLPGPAFAPVCLLVLLSGSWVGWVA